MSSFSKQTIRGTDFICDDNGNDVLHVKTPHALIQAVGYLKFTAEPYERIYLRGQSRLYDTFCPTLYRDVQSTATQTNRHKSLNAALNVFRKHCSIFGKFPDYAHEALLQHYGLHTSWIDVVDNIWIALWFSAYKAFSDGRHNEFLHFERRPLTENEGYGYIILLAASEDRKTPALKGLMSSKTSELIDLRIAAPSIFTRPHAQHGLLFRVKGTASGRKMDYSEAIRGVIRYNLSDAFNWLGDGNMIGVRGLFPPPYYDPGYQILLKAPHDDMSVGCVTHVGS